MMNAVATPPVLPAIEESLRAREAQVRWELIPVRERQRCIGELRHLIAENATYLAEEAASVAGRPVAEKLVSEVLPLADACRWLERNAARILAPRRPGRRDCPFWLRGHSFEVQRRAFGIVLVIGPGNYPLFLPAVHALHAIAAGNAVLLKPAPGTREVALAFRQLTVDAGLDPALLTVLPESVEAVHEVVARGVDKVVFTGSSANGRDLLAKLAQTSTPAVMELSGQDAVIVLDDADLDLVERALRFGTRLNSGETCIAPRRLIVVDSVADDLAERTSGLDLERVPDADEAVSLANASSFGIGASLFSRNVARARLLAARLHTGFVLINDLIVPTADPRMPFGGTKASGFGSTRGEEGLLEMTFPHVVAVRQGQNRPHYDDSQVGDARLFSAYIRSSHGRSRLAAIGELVGALTRRNRKEQS